MGPHGEIDLPSLIKYSDQTCNILFAARQFRIAGTANCGLWHSSYDGRLFLYFGHMVFKPAKEVSLLVYGIFRTICDLSFSDDVILLRNHLPESFIVLVIALLEFVVTSTQTNIVEGGNFTDIAVGVLELREAHSCFTWGSFDEVLSVVTRFI